MPTCITPSNEQNVITEMRYGPGGQLVALIAKNPVTGDQVTRYEYGVTLAESAVASNDLLRAEIYPDAADASDRVSYSYNRQGQRTRMQDQNGSVHQYEYDRLGRQTADKVTTLGSGVDGAVRRIGQSYEVRGLVEKITSYSDAAGTTPVNEVQNTYNSFAQLTEQYQEHSGGVDTDTTPKVEYAYADGSANTIRPTSMTYPNGRVLDYLYDDTHADKLSRIRTLRWDGMDVCRYSYLGLSTFVTTDYLQPQVKLDYAQGSGANPYTGFDRFGRIIDLLWAEYGTSSLSSSSSSGGSGIDLVHLKYGYDRASNRTYREDLVAQSYDKDFDELYEYDGLQRLKKFHRGRLVDNNTAIESPTLQQSWQLDATSNWQNFTQNDQADANQTLDQQRLHNRVNEITNIARTVGAEWATPEYDRNGNMTVIPQPKEMTTVFKSTWDAWNRLIKLVDSSTLAIVQENAYDGQVWRTMRKDYTEGVLSEFRHFFYTRRWQSIEERLAATVTPEGQHVWGLRYIDDLVLRDRDTDVDGDLDEQLYAQQDANWNVVSIADIRGAVAERYAYEPYGNTYRFDATWNTLSDSQFSWSRLFTGQCLDKTPKTYSYRFRMYNPMLGRFLCRDFLIYAGGHNLYSYVYNQSPSRVDPSGLRLLFPHLDAAEALDRIISSIRGVETHFSRRAIAPMLGEMRQQLNEICPEAKMHFNVAPNAFLAIGELVIDNVDPLCTTCGAGQMSTTGCQCLCDLVSSNFVYNVIFDAGISGPDGTPIWPHNLPDRAYRRGFLNHLIPWDDWNYPRYDIHLPLASVSEWEYGYYTNERTVRRYPFLWRVAAHELCGHAWREHHQAGDKIVITDEKRGNRSSHDIAVGIENQIAREIDPLGEGSQPRPLYGRRDSLHGESIGRNIGTGEWDLPGPGFPQPPDWDN
jgi:RHS repeat-associated protein